MAHWLDTVCPVGWICLEMALLVGGGVAHWLEMALLVGGGVAYRLEMASLVGGGVAHWLEMKIMVGGGMAHWLEVAWLIGWKWHGSLVGGGLAHWLEMKLLYLTKLRKTQPRQLCCHIEEFKPVLLIWIQLDPELFPGFGSGIIL